MGTIIAENLHHRRAAGHSPYSWPRERETRCEVPPLRMPDDLHDAASERDDDASRQRDLRAAQEAFYAYAIALCDNAVADEDVPPRLRTCLAELARQGRDLQQWQAELEGRAR